MSEIAYWVEHHDLGYAPGRVVSEVGECLTLTTEDGSTVTVEKAKAQPVHRNSLLGVPNLLDLGEFSMPALLHNIRVRYSNGEYYSSIGLPILISVNPYKPQPQLYDRGMRVKYTTADFGWSQKTVMRKVEGLPQSRTTQDLPAVADQKLFIEHPHLFGTAQMTFCALVRTKQAQSIVISGESGAGKTEATKILLRHFSDLECTFEESVNCIDKFIIKSNPILEAFGNAKTVRNDNSSRFGRFIQLYFDLNNIKRIKFARISHYLLEKCRLVSVHESERNFHIFYQLALGAQNHAEYGPMLAKWGLTEPENDFQNMLGVDIDCWYLGDEEDMFAELVDCLHAVRFSSEDIRNIFEVVAGLLHLSRVEFHALDSPQSTYNSGPLCAIRGHHALAKACDLLQIYNAPPLVAGTSADPLQAFSNLLLFKIFRNNEGQGNWIRSPRDKKDASQIRDSIIKETYSRLFDWIVKKINKTLMTKSESEQRENLRLQLKNRKPSTSTGPFRNASAPIGLLDIYGFEVFECGRNSFEQLCINYANEKLQQHFNQHVLALEQATYKNEAIEWNEVLFTDNRDIIRALEEPPNGVFVILDDTRVANKNHDELFLQEVSRRALKTAVTLPDIRQFKNMTFTVRHYAGNVDYSCQGFVQKNVDRLETQSSYFLSQATCSPLVKELFPHDPNDDIAFRRNSLKATLSVEFRNQLSSLIGSLTSTTPTYVRCIKPNNLKQYGVFNSKEVLRQLEYAGLLESIRIRNSGFGVRCAFKEFLNDYAFVLKNEFRRYHEAREQLGNEDLREMCRKVLTCSGKKGQWQLGITKVFMKEEVQIQLEQQRSLVRLNSSVKIQARVRAYLQRMRYLQIHRCVVKIQAASRCFLVRLFARRTRAATVIQRYWRYVLPAKKNMALKFAAILHIQTRWRALLRSREASIEAGHPAVDSPRPPPFPLQGPSSEDSAAGTFPKASESFPLADGTFPLSAGAFPLASGGFPLAAGGFPLAAGGFPFSNASAPFPAGRSAHAALSRDRPAHAMPGAYTSGSPDASKENHFASPLHRRSRAPLQRSGPQVHAGLSTTTGDRRSALDHAEHGLGKTRNDPERPFARLCAESSAKDVPAAFKLIYDELKNTRKKSSKEIHKLRQELNKARDELYRRRDEIAKLKKAQRHAEVEAVKRECEMSDYIEYITDVNDSANRKLDHTKRIIDAMNVIFNELESYVADRMNGEIKCELLADCIFYLRNACSRGFYLLRSAAYHLDSERSLEADRFGADRWGDERLSADRWTDRWASDRWQDQFGLSGERLGPDRLCTDRLGECLSPGKQTRNTPPKRFMGTGNPRYLRNTASAKVSSTSSTRNPYLTMGGKKIGVNTDSECICSPVMDRFHQRDPDSYGRGPSSANPGLW